MEIANIKPGRLYVLLSAAPSLPWIAPYIGKLFLVGETRDIYTGKKHKLSAHYAMCLDDGLVLHRALYQIQLQEVPDVRIVVEPSDAQG